MAWFVQMHAWKWMSELVKLLLIILGRVLNTVIKKSSNMQYFNPYFFFLPVRDSSEVQPICLSFSEFQWHRKGEGEVKRKQEWCNLGATYTERSAWQKRVLMVTGKDGTFFQEFWCKFFSTSSVSVSSSLKGTGLIPLAFPFSPLSSQKKMLWGAQVIKITISPS